MQSPTGSGLGERFADSSARNRGNRPMTITRNWKLAALTALAVAAGCTQTKQDQSNTEGDAATAANQGAPAPSAEPVGLASQKAAAFPKGTVPDIQVKDVAAVEPKAGSYLILLANRTDLVIVQADTRGNSGTWTGWSAVPATGRTCSLGSYQACVNAKAYKAILSVPCSSGSFDLRIATKWDADGNASGAVYTGLTPNCSYSGGVIGLEP